MILQYDIQSHDKYIHTNGYDMSMLILMLPKVGQYPVKHAAHNDKRNHCLTKILEMI